MRLKNILMMIDEKKNSKCLKIFSNLKMLFIGIVINVSFLKYETKHYEPKILM